MTSFEQNPPTERPCAKCPHRSKLSRALAQAGLFFPDESCSGTDTVDRFQIIRKTGPDLPYDEYSEGHITFGSSSWTDNPKPAVGYFAAESVREEPCPRDPITLAPDETVTEVYVNDLGKVRVKIGVGDPEDAKQFIRPEGWNPANTDRRPPLEILRSVRLVTVVRGEEVES